MLRLTCTTTAKTNLAVVVDTIKVALNTAAARRLSVVGAVERGAAAAQHADRGARGPQRGANGGARGEARRRSLPAGHRSLAGGGEPVWRVKAG